MSDESKEQGLVEALKGLWPHVRPFRTRLIVALLLAGALTVVGLLPPLVMRRLVNDVAQARQFGLLPLLIGGLFGITVLRALMTYFNARTIAYVGQKTVANIRQVVFDHLLALPLRYHERTPIGSLMQRLMADVGAVQNLVTGHVVTLIVDLITASFAISVMIGLSGELTLISLGLLPIFYLNYRIFTGRIQAANVQLRGQMDHVSSMLQERLSSHDLIVSYAQEDDSVQHFRDRVRASRDTALRGLAYNLGFNHATTFINGAGASIIYVSAVYLFLKGQIQYGDVVAFAAYSTQLMGPVVRFVRTLQAMNQSLVSIRRVNEVLGQPTGLPEGQKEVDAPSSGSVLFEGFAWSDPETGQVVLDEVDLRIKSGQNLTLVGPPAGGKTSLLRAIRRMFDPDTGSVSIDGNDARDYNLTSFRQEAPIVRETTAVFRGSIRGNLSYGRQNVTDEEFMEALDVVDFGDFVRGLSAGLETQVGAGGIRLSAGQRQRLGIARAIVAQPRILIIDEGTASLDPSSAAELLQRLYAHLPDTTILTVARRVGVARDADVIAVVEGGRVAEIGTHQELMALDSGQYRGLLEQQYGSLEKGTP